MDNNVFYHRNHQANKIISRNKTTIKGSLNDWLPNQCLTNNQILTKKNIPNINGQCQTNAIIALTPFCP